MEDEPVQKTEFSFGQTSIEVPAEGGEFTAAYILSNPVEGLEVEPKASEDWIHDFDMSTEGRVKFIVDSTDVEIYDREATLTLKYGEEEISLQIVQKGAEAQIELVVEQARYYSLIVKVVPKDPEMRVFFSVIDQEIMDSYASDDELFAADSAYLVKAAESSHMTYEEYCYYMWNTLWNRHYPLCYVLMRSIYGATDQWFEPGKDYCVYCYGINVEGKPMTQVYKLPTSTLPLIEDSNVAFDMDMSVSGQSVTLSVTPSDKSQLYVSGARLMESSDSNDELLRAVQMNIDNSIFMSYSHPGTVESGGVSWESLVEAISTKGDSEKTINIGVANASGKAYVYALDEMGNIISEGAVKDFTTEDIVLSENEITMVVSDIEFDKAQLSITTTNGDPYRLYKMVDDGSFENLSSDEIITKVRQEGDIVLGNASGNMNVPLTGLTSATNYILVAFGFDKQVVTTDAYVLRFTTPEIVEGGVKCEAKVIKWFNSIDAYNKYPSEFSYYEDFECAVVSTEATVSGDYDWYLYQILSTNTVGKMTDEQLLNMVNNLYKANGPSGPKEYFVVNFDVPMTLFAVAIDKEGNFGPVFRQEYTFTKDGCSPIDEFDLNDYL